MSVAPRWPALDTRGLRRHWLLEPAVAFLNHGSFGACPRAVLEQQNLLRERLEREPVRFMARALEGELDVARARLAEHVGADPDDLAFVTNATTGVNTVLRSLALQPGDELVTTSHDYNACRNAMRFVAECAGARLVIADVPFPIDDAAQVVEAVLGAVTSRTRLVLLDHVTSSTGLVFPIEPLVRELESRGVDVLVDGAHAPGMVEVDLRALGAAYYTANCHKWLCAPKGAAFLHVRRDKQAGVHPLVISHGANATRPERSRFRLELDWMGTADPTPYLCVPAALDFVGSLLPGGWPAVRATNRATALAARELLAEALDIPTPAPAAMIGSLAALLLPGSGPPTATPLHGGPLQQQLFEEYGIEVPIIPWTEGRCIVRMSAQLYNDRDDYERLARALGELL